MFEAQGQRGGPGPRSPAEVGAEPRGRPAPARDAPQLRGRSVRGKPAGVTSKRDTPRPQSAPQGRNRMGTPPSPLPAAAATPPLPPAEFRGRPKFPGKREKSPERPRRGRVTPQLSLPTPPLRFPRCRCFAPSRRGPGPTHRDRARRAAEPAGGGAGPGRSPAPARSLNTSSAQSAERMKIFTRIGH